MAHQIMTSTCTSLLSLPQPRFDCHIRKLVELETSSWASDFAVGDEGGFHLVLKPDAKRIRTSLRDKDFCAELF